jgi:hypothetical protein
MGMDVLISWSGDRSKSRKLCVRGSPWLWATYGPGCPLVTFTRGPFGRRRYEINLQPHTLELSVSPQRISSRHGRGWSTRKVS